MPFSLRLQTVCLYGRTRHPRGVARPSHWYAQLQERSSCARIHPDMSPRVLPVVFVALLFCSCSAPFRMARPAPTSVTVLERLGAEHALILTADDFGRNHATNLGVTRGIEHGAVSCVALMPVGSEVDEAYEYISKHRELDVGVHLVLARDNVEPRWRPVLPPEEVPTLVDADGCFHSSIWHVLLKGDRAEIEKELAAQIEEVIARGIDPTFLSFHKGFFQMHDPKTFDIILRLARKYDLPVRRQALFHERSIAEAGVLTTDKLVYDFGSYPNHEKRKKLLSTIDWLPRGLTELVLHLAVEGEDEGNVRSRALELKVITDPEVKEYLERKQVRLIGYRMLRDVQRSLPRTGNGVAD